MKESIIMKHCMLALSDAGVLVFRNNVGQYQTTEGRVIRYGVGNPGGSDLICCVPVTITADMVGKTVGVFAAPEIKTSTGKLRKDQVTFQQAVLNAGGIAGVARSPEEALELISRLGRPPEK